MFGLRNGIYLAKRTKRIRSLVSDSYHNDMARELSRSSRVSALAYRLTYWLIGGAHG